MTELTPELERKLGAAVERMPAFPRSVQRVLELSRNINCPPKEIVAVIEKDPVMTMKIFKVINSAYYALPNRITSVGQSVVYLGINTVKNLALGFAAVGILPRTTTAGFDVQRYLLHSLVVAGVARQLCHRYADDEADPGDCYVAGLLHDFGKIVLAQFLPAEFSQAMRLTTERKIPLFRAEEEVIGISHGPVGAMLARRWVFPEPLVECIGNHHRQDAPASALLDCLRTADQIVRLRSIGDSGNPWFDDEPPAAPERFGDDLGAVIDRIGSLDRIVDEASAFVQVAHE